jgi:excisionase family DNA binding protein
MTEPTINDHNAGADRLAVSPAEAARLAGVGRTTIYEAIGSGALRSLKIGKRRLILIVSLIEWLETAQAAARRRAHDNSDAEASEESSCASQPHLEGMCGQSSGQQKSVR